MHEILYIQAGRAANYFGTHFWNTQEAYFTYDEDEGSYVDHDISWREGLSSTNSSEPTYCPRVLIFDYKPNFGSLSRYNALYPEGLPDETDAGTGDLWDGQVDEHHQPAAPVAPYQQALEDENAMDTNGEPQSQTYHPGADEVAYWSDYNRVYYVPRSLHSLPEPPEWAKQQSMWTYSCEQFQRLELDESLMDDSVRHFTEECDLLQGLNVTLDLAPFGGFTTSLLAAYKDEYPKHPILCASILPEYLTSSSLSNVAAHAREILDSAVYFSQMHELECTTIPLTSPKTWQTDPWSENLSFNRQNIFQTSAIASAVYESATLPLRLRSNRPSLLSLCDSLNIRGGCRFSSLMGTLPFVEGELRTRVHDFSFLSSTKQPARKIYDLSAGSFVARGVQGNGRRLVEDWVHGQAVDLPQLPPLSYLPSYPLPSSFPTLFDPRLTSGGSATSTNVSIPLVSALVTSSSTAVLFKALASSLDTIVKDKVDVDSDQDELRGLKDQLWTICDNYGYDADEDVFGEDEL
ncbi:tubulin nucleotide-binding domain-like protein [Sistotremastrum niveocremeum HHB9708]|uniref:Tubulin nucleotide-binding domain-like protein n=1 Tax=Sistotremastrum niveocremeum HHB9708 TaxID=1314777 RepID=A0A164Q428_9AGAM|nr:tubulin nucleotide-binding domain-like protein [Sistotremastrum niveocremeum HHB9708]